MTSASDRGYAARNAVSADDATSVAPACTALVAVSPRIERVAPTPLSRPDPSFVAHLIAMAQQSPQTRGLRRAAIADVEAAYRCVANQNLAPTTATGERMRLSA
jgi:hypothetical protein